jgi:hypothetical protein
LLCFLPSAPQASPKRETGNGCCAAGLENLVADEKLRGRESRAKPELKLRPRKRKSKPKRGVYCVMPMAPLALPPARPRKFLGANNVQRYTGALVLGALMGALMGALAGGCLG